MDEIKVVSILTTNTQVVIPEFNKSKIVSISTGSVPVEVKNYFDNGQRVFWGQWEIVDGKIIVTHWACENLHKQNEKLQTFLDFFGIQQKVTDGRLIVKIGDDYEYEVKAV